MTVFIHDASILLDLIHTELLQLFLVIPAGMITTDFVVGEITDEADKEKLTAATTSGALEVLTSGLAEIESIAAVDRVGGVSPKPVRKAQLSPGSSARLT